jgi:hypothetical protein
MILASELPHFKESFGFALIRIDAAEPYNSSPRVRSSQVSAGAPSHANHGDALIHRADQRTKVAAHALGFIHARNTLERRGIRPRGELRLLRAPCASPASQQSTHALRASPSPQESDAVSTCPFTGPVTRSRWMHWCAPSQQAMWQRSQPMHFCSSIRATIL